MTTTGMEPNNQQPRTKANSSHGNRQSEQLSGMVRVLRVNSSRGGVVIDIMRCQLRRISMVWCLMNDDIPTMHT